MKTLRSLVSLVMLLLLVVALGAMPLVARAQETADPTVSVEPNPTADTGTVVPPGDVEPVPTEPIVQVPTSTLNLVLIGGFVLAGIAMLLNNIQQGRIKKETKDQFESAYQALPPVWQETILDMQQAARRVLNFFDDVTDGQPNIDDVVDEEEDEPVVASAAVRRTPRG